MALQGRRRTAGTFKGHARADAMIASLGGVACAVEAKDGQDSSRGRLGTRTPSPSQPTSSLLDSDSESLVVDARDRTVPRALGPSIEAIRAQYYAMFRGTAGAKSVAADSNSDSARALQVIST